MSSAVVWLVWRTARGHFTDAHAVIDGKAQCPSKPKRDAIVAPDDVYKCERCRNKLAKGASFGRILPNYKPKATDPKTVYEPRYRFGDWNSEWNK